jgi:hypothetical protein
MIIGFALLTPVAVAQAGGFWRSFQYALEPGISLWGMSAVWVVSSFIVWGFSGSERTSGDPLPGRRTERSGGDGHSITFQSFIYICATW